MGERTNSMAAGIREAMIMASWPAPLTSSGCGSPSASAARCSSALKVSDIGVAFSSSLGVMVSVTPRSSASVLAVAQQPFQRREPHLVAGVADVQRAVGLAGNDVHRAGQRLHHAHGGDQTGGGAGQVLGGHGEAGGGGQRVAAQVHRGGPGVRGLSHEVQHHAVLARDAFHHAQGSPGMLQDRALLGVNFEVTQRLALDLGVGDLVDVQAVVL